MSSIGTNGPCDISASETNATIQNRLNYIQSVAVTHPPGYGFPYVAPQRTQLTCISMSFTMAAQNQATYKKSVISSMNKNTFITTKSHKLTNILNGFTAVGQPSSQYGTQNWTYTSSNTRNTPQYTNATIACQLPLGSIVWFNIVTNSVGTNIVATSVNGSIYYSIDSGLTWFRSLLPLPNNGIGPTPYLTFSSNIGSNKVSLIAQNAIYKSINYGQTWSFMLNISGSLITHFAGIISSNDGATNIYAGINDTGTTMVQAINTNTLPYPTIADPVRFTLDVNLPIYSPPDNYVQFMAITSGKNADILWACGNINQSYIPGGFLSPISGYYIWRSDTSGSSWTPGINPDLNYSDRIVDPSYPGTDITLSVIATDASGQRVAVAGYRDPIATFAPNFWIQPSFVPQPAVPPFASTTFSSSYGFSQVTNAYNWYAIAMSPDGQTIVASSAENPAQDNIGFIYVSLNGGTTCSRTSATSGVWVSLTIANGGQTIIAASSKILDGLTVLTGGYIYISNNYGASWIQSNTLII